MKFISYLIVASLLLMFACQNPQRHKSENLKSGEPAVKSTEYETKSGKKFIVRTDHSIGASICDVQIETCEFEVVNTIHKIGTIDPVEEVFLADLDKMDSKKFIFLQEVLVQARMEIFTGLLQTKTKVQH